MKLFDFKANYQFDLGDYGTFNTRLAATIFDEYVFTDAKGIQTDVLVRELILRLQYLKQNSPGKTIGLETIIVRP